MNNTFNRFNFEEKKPKGGLPAWIWVIGVIGLIIAVLSGYFYGVEVVDIYSSIIIPDTNGEDTSLTVLDFSECIGVYDNEFGYNRFDSDTSFALKYDSTVKYNNAKGMYPNDFSDSDTVNCRIDFGTFNYYDITYAKNVERDTVFTFSSSLEKGNLEARIFRVDEKFKVKTGALGSNVIENQYVYEVANFAANENGTVTLTGGNIYVLVVGCESATGSYSFKTE